MNRYYKSLIGLVILISVVLITFRVIDHEPTDTMTLDQQAKAILKNSGCMKCHAGKHTDKFDIKRLEISINTIKDSLKRNQNYKIGSSDSVLISKFTAVINSGEMPPFSFTILRPGSSVNERESEILLEWSRVSQ